MNLYKSLLARGYFPKELPPTFGTLAFSQYALSTAGRAALDAYQAPDHFTECVTYRLARHGMRQRELRIPHPASYSKLAKLVAGNFKRLIGLTKASNFTGSEPVPGRERALEPRLKPWDLSVGRANIRAGSTHLPKVDVSEFYPSLYTHAVGWAIDPKLRLRKNWRKGTLLGKKVDQALMDWDGKLSQGLPIGNDISFLFAEVVLAQVDGALKATTEHAFRWFDDYEFAFDSRDGAEVMLKKLTRELARYRLRLNPKKTVIQQLPVAAGEDWQDMVKADAPSGGSPPSLMVKYFDNAIRLREQHPDAAVLTYALGTLFKISLPSTELARVANSCISQVILLEPGAAQKAFALWAFWQFNGLRLDNKLIVTTVEKMIDQHQVTGFSNDVSWALSFCLDYGLTLGKAASKTLSGCDDDCIALQALHMRQKGLLSKRFDDGQIVKTLRNSDLDREHWLLAYESVQHGFLQVSRAAIRANSLFSDMLARKISFYRWPIEKSELITHFGGAPQSVTSIWGAYKTVSEANARRRHPLKRTGLAVDRDIPLPTVIAPPRGTKGGSIKDVLILSSGY